jgi:2-dehydropantoate 2-reductase
MKIAVMGAGAMGSVFGGLLSKAGEGVCLIDPRETLIETIIRNGLSLTIEGKEEILRPRATSTVEEAGTADLVVFFMKSFDTARAARSAKSLLTPHTYAMTLQNGIDNASKIVHELQMERVIYGTTRLGAVLKEPGHAVIDHLPKSASTHIGEWAGNRSPTLSKVSEILNNAGILNEISEEIDLLLYKKLSVAASLGMLTALSRLRVKDLLATEEGEELACLVAEEVVQVAKQKGIPLSRDETIESIHASKSSTHITSMLKSVLDKERLEVDSINGSIAREAEALGFSAPANRTIALLTKVIEKTYDRRLE